MQRIFPLFCTLFALYVSGFAIATPEGQPAAKPFPHIALLLPLNSQGLSQAADAVRQGFMTAAKVLHAGLPIALYSDFDETHSVVDAYNAAVAQGAVAVVGPLTRGSIRKLAEEKSLPVPTLALNLIEGQSPPQMYFFGMEIEAEAQQVARLARKQNLKQAIVISANDPLARRLQYAFEDQWTALGGTVEQEIDYSGDASAFSNVQAGPDSMVFFATDAESSRAIRSYLPGGLAVYATSQIYTGNGNTLLNYDLEGVRFVDMPWLMEEGQPPIAAYLRPDPEISTDRERLYALGIDAYSLMQILLNNQMATSLPFDGVTGRITLNDHTFLREALPSLFVQGHAQSADAPLAPVVPMFPAQFKAESSVDAASSVEAESSVNAASSVQAAPTH